MNFVEEKADSNNQYNLNPMPIDCLDHYFWNKKSENLEEKLNCILDP